MGMNTLGGFSGAFQGLYDAYNRWQNQRQNMEAQSGAYRQRAFESMADLARNKENQAAAVGLAEKQKAWADDRLTKELTSREKIAGISAAAMKTKNEPSDVEKATAVSRLSATKQELLQRASDYRKAVANRPDTKLGPGQTIDTISTPYDIDLATVSELLGRIVPTAKAGTNKTNTGLTPASYLDRIKKGG